jgi:hypothetical protein
MMCCMYQIPLLTFLALRNSLQVVLVQNATRLLTITSGDTTVLIWDNGRFQRTITHSKGIADIPLLPVNDDFNTGDALFCEPCSLLSSYQPIPPYLHSSKSIKVQEGVTLASEGVPAFRNAVLAPPESNTQADGYWRDGKWVPLPRVWSNGRWERVEVATMPWETNLGESPETYSRIDPKVSSKVPLDDSLDDEEAVAPTTEPTDDPIEFDVTADFEYEQPDVCPTREAPGELERPTNQTRLTETEKILNAMRSPLSKMDREYLRIHHRLKHLSRRDMFKLAKKGIIPRRFGKPDYEPPQCAACIFGKQRRRSWRTGKSHGSLRRHPGYPGEQTHVDQIVSSHPGLIPQTKGRLTRARYVGATVFVDEASDFTYCHLMRDLSDEETLEAKHSYEHLMKTKDVTVKRYHCDNGAFANSKYREDGKIHGQVNNFLRCWCSPSEWDC